MAFKFMRAFCFGLGVLLSISVHAESQNRNIKILPVANWIEVEPVLLPEQLPMESIDGGVYYALIDNQVRVPEKGKPEFFTHYAVKVVNQQGLESESQINIEYDPIYEDVVLNSIVIHRNGKQIDKTGSSRMSVMQRETQMENLLYDGRLTVNIIIDDVRVDDIVEYSYTSRGTNPVYNNYFGYERYVEWSVPVYKQNIKVLWGKQTPLYVTKSNTDINITEHSVAGYKVYQVEISESQPHYVNSEIPGWYDPYGIVFFSEFRNWGEIVQWALPLYENAIESSVQVKEIAGLISEKFQDKSQQIVAALKYVQNEVRYLGIEMGTNSHKPSLASETLKRRYGDCKDKAVLFVSILRGLGIEASPSLVNTNRTKHLAMLPAIVDAFNHVLVKVRYGEKNYWLDPTRLYQSGKLDDIYQPDYGYALTIGQHVDKLERMNDPSGRSRMLIQDVFDLTAGVNKDVIFESVARYSGGTAERQRYIVAKDGLSVLRDKYIDFYSQYYSSAEPVNDLTVSVDDDTGSVEIKEKYSLRKFWKEDKKDKDYSSGFYANSIISYLEKPDQLNRNSPYDLAYPVNISQNVEVRFAKESWAFDDNEFVENNKFFQFKSSAKFDKMTMILRLSYEYKTIVDHVAVNDLDAYIAALGRAKDKTEYLISYTSGAASQAQPSDDKKIIGFVVSTVILIYVAGILFIIINWRNDARTQPQFQDVYYPVSLAKFVGLSIVTFGIYLVYWFYRNWLYRKKMDKSAIMPVMRGIFSLFWYYPLYNNLVKDSLQRYGENRVLLKPLAIILAVLYLVVGLVENLDNAWIITIVVAPLLVVPFANYINHINESNQEGYNYNSRWLARHTVTAVLVLPLFLWMAATHLNILPGTKVINGDAIADSDLKFMQRAGVVNPGEKIIYFYSDALLNLHDDGNGFTDNRVFSYWNDNGNFNYETEEFSNVQDIEVAYSNTRNGNTVITVKKIDGGKIMLFVSAKDGMDKTFVDEMHARWRKNHPQDGVQDSN